MAQAGWNAKPKTLSKKRQKSFDERALAMLERIGAKPWEGSFSYTHQLETPAGRLFIGCDASGDGNLATVFTRFEDAGRGHYATQHIFHYPNTDSRSNSYSGKWNWHMSGDGVVDAETCFGRFEDAIRQLMALPYIQPLPPLS